MGGSTDTGSDPRVTALNFVDAVWRQGSLLDAWQYTHPTLRLCFAQTWLMPLRRRAIDDGYVPDEVAATLASGDSSHPLWEKFNSTLIGGFRGWGDLADSSRFRFGMHDRPWAPDLELLHFYDMSGFEGDVIPAGAGSGHTFLMAYGSDGWQVLNVGSDSIPEPGWPPRTR